MKPSWFSRCLASQIATAIHNVRLLEVEQGSIHEVVETYLAGYKIDRAGRKMRFIK